MNLNESERHAFAAGLRYGLAKGRIQGMSVTCATLTAAIVISAILIKILS